MGKSYQKVWAKYRKWRHLWFCGSQIDNCTVLYTVRKTAAQNVRPTSAGCGRGISAFNFGGCLVECGTAWICGNVVVWNRAKKFRFAAWLVRKFSGSPVETICRRATIVNVITKVGEMMTQDWVALVRHWLYRMGKIVAQTVAARLEKPSWIGRNNAIIVTPVQIWKHNQRWFGAVGTAGQRCTTTRRL